MVHDADVWKESHEIDKFTYEKNIAIVILNFTLLKRRSMSKRTQGPAHIASCPALNSGYNAKW